MPQLEITGEVLESISNIALGELVTDFASNISFSKSEMSKIISILNSEVKVSEKIEKLCEISSLEKYLAESKSLPLASIFAEFEKEAISKYTEKINKFINTQKFDKSVSREDLEKLLLEQL